MLNPEKINCPLSLVVILYHTSSKALVLALSVDCYSFPASSDSHSHCHRRSHQRQQLLTLYKAPRCCTLVREPRGAAAGGPSAPSPTDAKGSARTPGALTDAVAAGPRRAPRSAGSCRAEHLPIASADITGSRQERSQDR